MSKKLSKEQLVEMGLLPKEHVVNEMHDQPEENLGEVEEAFHNAEVVENVEVVEHPLNDYVPQEAQNVAPPASPEDVPDLFADLREIHSKRAGLALDFFKVLIQADKETPRMQLVDEAYALADHFQETLDNRFQDSMFKRMTDAFGGENKES